jgi:hypothetical protein
MQVLFLLHDRVGEQRPIMVPFLLSARPGAPARI